MKKITFCFVLISWLIIFVACNKGNSWNEFEVNYEKREENVEQKEGKYNISYPFFKDYPELNEAIKERVEFEKKYISEAKDMLEYDVNFGDIRTSGKYIGFMFNTSSYFKGDTHPTAQIYSFNYDMEEKREVKLNDIFSPLSKDYLKIFSEFCYKELTARVERGELASSDDFITEGTDIKEANFSCFNIKGSEVIIVFNQYQVAPYSSGISEVSIPLNIFK